MPNKSLYQQISNPIETYTDGYGQTREVYEPKYVGVLRKAYNLANRFLNGPSEEEYAQMGMRKPQYSLGPAEWIAGPAKVISGTNKAIKAAKPLSKPQSKLGDLNELAKLREKLGISTPKVTEKELKYWDIMERADLDDLAKPVTGPSKESLDFIKETLKNLSK